LRKLQNDRIKLKEQEKSSTVSNDRDALLGASNGKSYGRESELTRDMTTDQMQSHAQLEMKKQDEHLEVMSQGLTVLQNLGTAIGDETDLQMVRNTNTSRE
jgi:hypothetical protein